MTRLPKVLTSCTISLGALSLLACPAGDDTSETGSTETGSTGDGDGDPTGDGDGDPATGDGDGDGSLCGNGDLDDGEECDDGNNEDGDGCSASCTVSSCGLSWSVTSDVPNSNSGGFDTYIAADGSIYTTGAMDGADRDIWVAKWNPDGSEAWSQTFDSGTGNDAGFAITVSDAVYVAGYMAGDGRDIWYASLDPAGGSENWSQMVASEFMGEDDVATGIDIDADGELIISGEIRAGDGDNDVWLRRASTVDGTEIWTTTWSGAGDGSFSIDVAGSVSAASDGTYWVAAREYFDFETQYATLLHFAADGAIVDAFQPQASGAQTHSAIDVLATDDGVYFIMWDGDFPFESWLYKFDTNGAEQWVITHEDWFMLGGEIGSDWRPIGLGLDGAGNIGVGGAVDNEEAGEGIDWTEAFVAKLNPADGSPVCIGRHQVDDGNFIPPSLGVDGAHFSDGGFGVTAIETAGQGNATKMWTGHFLP